MSMSLCSHRFANWPPGTQTALARTLTIIYILVCYTTQEQLAFERQMSSLHLRVSSQQDSSKVYASVFGVEPSDDGDIHFTKSLPVNSNGKRINARIETNIFDTVKPPVQIGDKILPLMFSSLIWKRKYTKKNKELCAGTVPSCLSPHWKCCVSVDIETPITAQLSITFHSFSHNANLLPIFFNHGEKLNGNWFFCWYLWTASLY